MIFPKDKKISICLFLVLGCILGFVIILCFRTKKNERNNYFFDHGNAIVEYQGYIIPLSGNEIMQKVKLNIIPLETFGDGDLYILKLDDLEVEDPWDQIAFGRETLGYFYVTSERIYRYALPYDKFVSDEENQKIINYLKNDLNTFLDTCDIVFSKDGIKDIPDEDGWHKYIEVDGDKCTFHLYNDYISGTRFYEEIVWEKNKGIIYYKSGSGSMLMHIEFGVGCSQETNVSPMDKDFLETVAIGLPNPYASDATLDMPESLQRPTPVEYEYRKGDVDYEAENTVYLKTYYDDGFALDPIMHFEYPKISLEKDLKDYFVRENGISVTDGKKIIGIFFDPRTIEMEEEELRRLFYEHGFELHLQKKAFEGLNVRFIEIREIEGLSLFPTRVAIQTWDTEHIRLQEITGALPRKIRSLISIDNKEKLRLVVHSSGLSVDYIWEEELSFWEFRDTYWALVPMDLTVDSSHAHEMGSLPDLIREELFEPVYYRDGIVYRTSRQNDTKNTHTLRLGKMEEIEHNKSFRLIGVSDNSGRSVESLTCYLQYEIN